MIRTLFSLTIVLCIALSEQVLAHEAKGNDPQSAVMEGAAIVLPDVMLVSQANQTLSLRGDIARGHRIVIAFQYTNCPQYCPITNVVMKNVDVRLAEGNFDDVRLMSITLDPQTDTPDVLLDASRKFDASSQWLWLTGSSDALRKIYRAFGAGTGPKEEHLPFFLVGSDDSGEFTRIEGLPRPEEILSALEHARTR